MEAFRLGNQIIEFDDEFEVLNALRSEIIQASGQSGFSEVLNGMLEKYGADKLGEMIVKSFPDTVYSELCKNLVPPIIDFLFGKGIYDCDEQTFIHKYAASYFDFASQPTFINFSNHYNEIVGKYLKEQEEKEYYRSGRSRWVGGGFGIKGAIKGALQAHAMNLVQDAFRGIGDSISDAFSASSFKRKKMGLISESAFRDLEIAFDNCVLGVFLACQHEYAEHKKISVPWDMPENQNRAKAIFNNAKVRAVTTDQLLSMVSEAIRLAPYNHEFYEFLYQRNACNRTEINALAEHLGYSLRPIRLSLFWNRFEEIQEKYHGENGLITEIVENGAADSNIEALQTIAGYDRQYADEIIDAGLAYGLFARSDDLSLSVDTTGSTPERAILEIAFSAVLNGLDSEAEALILEEKYDSAAHAAFLAKLDKIVQEYSCERYALLQNQNAKEIVDRFTNGKILEDADEEKAESIVLDYLEQLDEITDDETISHEEKKQLILKFPKETPAECPEDDKIAELKKAITVALAWEALAQKYEKKVEEEVLSPDKDMHSLADGIRELLFEAGIIDSKDSYKISDRFSVPYFPHFGTYNYSAYDYCNDMLITVKDMLAYFAEKKLGRDYEMREKIGTAILAACQNDKGASRLRINKNLDPGFMKRELTYDGARNFVEGGNAKVRRDDIIYVCYYKNSLLGELFVGFAGDGIYEYKDQSDDTVLYPWSEIAGIQISSLDFTITLRSGTRKTLELGGLTWSATKIAEQIWKIVKDATAEKGTEDAVYTFDSRTFLSRRLEHFLSGTEKDAFYLGGYTDDELISDIYHGCEEITKIEPNPYVALFYSPDYVNGNNASVDATNTPFILITNRNIFFRGPQKIEHLPITSVDTFGLSTDTLWIIEKESKKNYPISFHGYAGSLEDLGAHLYHALIVDLT